MLINTLSATVTHTGFYVFTQYLCVKIVRSLFRDKHCLYSLDNSRVTRGICEIWSIYMEQVNQVPHIPLSKQNHINKTISVLKLLARIRRIRNKTYLFKEVNSHCPVKHINATECTTLWTVYVHKLSREGGTTILLERVLTTLEGVLTLLSPRLRWCGCFHPVRSSYFPPPSP